MNTQSICIGSVFNYLTVVDNIPTKTKARRAYYTCQCKCGRITQVRIDLLKSGGVKSCGCIKKDPNHNASKHACSSTPEYRSWLAMKARCNNPNSSKFYMYGAKGIKVSPEWNDSFETFLKDMGLKPSPKHSIERKEGTKGYSKENCVWATPLEQANNTKMNRPITYQGITLNLSQWARKLKIPVTTLLGRLDNRGMSVELAFTAKAWERV